MQNSEIKFVFFGTPAIAVTILNTLKEKKLLPSLVITAPDRPSGRGMKLTSPPTKTWADENNIPVFQPETLDENFITKLKEENPDLFVVFAYSAILKNEVINIPKYGALNLHPSLLPKLRGPSPIVSAILTDSKKTGVTVIKIDEKMDHGPILSQAEITPDAWPLPVKKLEEILLQKGGELLADTIPKFIAGEVTLAEQNHDEATFCKMLTKEDGLIDLDEDPYQNFLKINAYANWPGTYFFTDEDVRVKITSAYIENEKLVIDTVIPAGKKEMSYVNFRQS